MLVTANIMAKRQAQYTRGKKASLSLNVGGIEDCKKGIIDIESESKDTSRPLGIVSICPSSAGLKTQASPKLSLLDNVQFRHSTVVRGSTDTGLVLLTAGSALMVQWAVFVIFFV